MPRTAIISSNLLGCSLTSTIPPDSGQQSVYLLPEIGDTLLNKHAPVFLVEDSQKTYNRIGTPTVRVNESGKEDIYIKTDQATIYTMTQDFETAKGRYTNLIYRVQFPSTPYNLIPFTLGAGDNPGLLVILTLDAQGRPVLVSQTGTCGCYLGMIPTAQAGLPNE